MDEADALVEHQGALVPREWLRAIETIAQGADRGSVVLIRGEAGTGKDVVARMLHTASGRGRQLFVKVNCAARPADRLAIRLFGHERDAWAGAGRRKLGAVEFANRGTLFLDDIGALPPPLHSQVLRVLQGEDIVRPGAATARAIDVRVVLATRQPLVGSGNGLIPWQSAPALKVVDLQLPPLRARPGHIPPLAEFFLDRFNAWYNADVRFSAEELTLLGDYAWPGNVRELETVIRHLVASPTPGAPSRALRVQLDRMTPSLDRQTA